MLMQAQVQAREAPPGPAPSPETGRARPGSIVRRLVVFALGLAVPILIFGGVVLWQFANAARERLEAEALGRARMEAAAVDREVASLIATLEALSLSNALQRGDVTGEGRVADGAAHVGGTFAAGGAVRKTRNAVINASPPEIAAGAISAYRPTCW